MTNFYLHQPVSFQAMAKPIGATCNLRCTYCYYLEKEKLYANKGSKIMADNVLERFIKQYIATQQVNEINFVWQGGEPSLLGLDYFKKIVDLQFKHANGKKIENSFQTNGTLLTDEWCRFFKKYNFLVGISIDGPTHLHDTHRPYTTGGTSFPDVMRGINRLRKHGVAFNTLTVVHRHNAADGKEIYSFLKEIGSSYMQFIPIVERQSTVAQPSGLTLVGPDDPTAVVTEWSVTPRGYGQFLVDVFDEWVRHDVGRFFVQQFDAALANWVGQNPGICVFAKNCGQAVVVEHNGDVYSCDHYVYPEYKLGNINERTLLGMVTSEKQVAFGIHKSASLPPDCMKCEFRFACHGECPKHRFTKSSNGDMSLNYLCTAYKRFFSHVAPYMDYMADQIDQKKAPSNVMQVVSALSGN